jgi:hypothetical protein
MNGVNVTFDLSYDPNEVGGDMVVECWIPNGPGTSDPIFDPRPGDWVIAGDEELPPRLARVVRRQGDRVWIQLGLSPTPDA